MGEESLAGPGEQRSAGPGEQRTAGAGEQRTAGPGKDAPRRRSAPRRAGFVLVSCLAALLGLEGALRLGGLPEGVVWSLGHCWADAQSSSLGPFRPNYRATIAFPKELTWHPSFNSLGLRGAELSLARTSGVPRVLCAGDSTTLGFHVEDPDAYPARLEARLLGAGRRVEVANGGCGSWTITDERSFLEARALALSPDVVVLLFCGNDLGELDQPSRYEEQERFRREGESLPRRFLHATAIYEGHLRLRLALAKGRGPVDLAGRPDARDDDHWRRYAEELRRLEASVHGKGARLLVASFPGANEIKESACDTEQRLPGLVASLDKERTAYVDLYGPFRAREREGLYNLPLDLHANARGNDVIAETIARALVERGWLVSPGEKR